MYKNKIISIGEKQNGYITCKNLKQLGIPSIYLTRLLKEGTIRKVEKGIYLLEGFLEDDFYTYYLKYPKLVYSKRTSLYLNNLTNKQLIVCEANLPRPYHIRAISNFKLNYVNKTIYELGQIDIKTPFNNIVKAYDLERCICDLFLFDYADEEEIRYVLREYKKREMNLNKLYDYAETLNILERIKILLGVL